MPIYKFKKKVEEIAVERGIHIVGSQDNLLRKIEKALENKEITSEEVKDMLLDDKDFRLHFSSDDFEKIRKVINE